MADEADPNNMLAAKYVGFRAAYRPGARTAPWQLGSTKYYHPLKQVGLKAL